ncbi:hypothetical protein ACPOL_5338 [Acidisarcina polymorpha]|uniref:Uncharacterized protein n=1 Tax=Acidisarcina polymorpha TaxID=2211140 RepID=A0A2Z5G666_9BACT|nr:hypothetical protein ACPOL_5338 [Acidisarcina polymorpha]
MFHWLNGEVAAADRMISLVNRKVCGIPEGARLSLQQWGEKAKQEGQNKMSLHESFLLN